MFRTEPGGSAMKSAFHLAAFLLAILKNVNARSAKRHRLQSVSCEHLPFISGGCLVLLLWAQTYSALAAAIPEAMSPTQNSHTAIVFYAQPQVSDDLWAALSQHLRLADGARELLNGLDLDKEPTLVRGSEDLLGTVFSKVIVVKLLGSCDVFPQPERPALRGPLGWVMLISGEVQPYVSIDCTRLVQVLRPKLIGLTKAGRRDAMAQAIAQVLIHEWIHIATQSSSHGARGVRQASLSADELISASPHQETR
jgi:hypothetical protein